MNQDEEHLRLLSIFHYINSGIIAFYSSFALIYVVMGLMFAGMAIAIPFDVQPTSADSERQESQAAGPNDSVEQVPTNSPTDDRTGEERRELAKKANQAAAAMISIFGILFAVIGAFVLLLGIAFATATFLAGRFLANRTHRLFCLVVACINCLNLPFGTILGVCTLIVLLRPSVQALFSAAEST